MASHGQRGNGSGRGEDFGGRPSFSSPLPDLLSIQEVAWRLSISRSEVRALITRGEIESLALGRRRLIPRASYELFLRRIQVGEEGPGGPPSSFEIVAKSVSRSHLSPVRGPSRCS